MFINDSENSQLNEYFILRQLMFILDFLHVCKSKLEKMADSVDGFNSSIFKFISIIPFLIWRMLQFFSSLCPVSCLFSNDLQFLSIKKQLNMDTAVSTALVSRRMQKW